MLTPRNISISEAKLMVDGSPAELAHNITAVLERGQCLWTRLRSLHDQHKAAVYEKDGGALAATGSAADNEGPVSLLYRICSGRET